MGPSYRKVCSYPQLQYYSTTSFAFACNVFVLERISPKFDNISFFWIYDFLCLSSSGNYRLILFNNPRNKVCFVTQATKPHNPSNTRSRGTTQSAVERPNTNGRPRKSQNLSDPKGDKKTKALPKRPTWSKTLYLKPLLFSILYQKEILEYLKSFKSIKVQSNIRSPSFIF